MGGQKAHRDFGPIFWIHLIFIIFFYLSPFLLDWRLMAAGGGLLYLQWYFLRGCVFTIWEFGREGHNNFNWYYLNRLGIHVHLERVRVFTDYIIPIGLIVVCLVWQIILGHQPWLISL